MRGPAFYLPAGFILYRLLILLVKKVNRKWWYRVFYLNSLHWKFLRFRKRLWVIWKYGEIMCEECRSTKKPHHCHHKTYVRIGRERLSDLSLLCMSCHAKKHRGKHGDE